ncbi:MAG: permease-like cell division protein FtsX [Staphylococcus sp.]|nr:permease-like cell division protein FtsX [Staphylococcus sp.]
MAKRRQHLIPLFTTRATATFSVALVLFILGLATFMGIAAHRVTEGIKENMGFIVLFNEDVTASDISDVKARLAKEPGVNSMAYSSPEVVLDRWQKMMGEDEDIISLAGVNPFVGELKVKMKSRYASADSIALIAEPLALMPQVSEIKIHTEIVDHVNKTLSSVSLWLIFIAIALLTVSFILIFNTVRLSVYARRFTIYTMKLVGATASFIRRPFLMDNVVNGLVAGIIASVALALSVAYSRSVDFSIAEILTWETVIAVSVGVIIVGILICLVAAIFAANRYLRLSYDEMFK